MESRKVRRLNSQIEYARTQLAMWGHRVKALEAQLKEAEKEDKLAAEKREEERKAPKVRPEFKDLE